MIRIRLAAAALSLSCLASAMPAAAASGSDDFDAVADRYERLVSIIRKSRPRLSPDDRPAIESLLADVTPHTGSDAHGARALAMELQLMQWLDHEPAEIDERFTRLERLRPDDIALLEAANRFRLANELVTEEEIQEGYLDLANRLPNNERALQLWAGAMNARGEYAGVVSRLESTIDPATSLPRLVTLYLDAMLNLGRYEAVIAALDTLGERTDVEARAEFGMSAQLRRIAEPAVTTWAEETARRAADAADLPRVRLTTPHGSIVVELFEDDVPNTVANFIALTRDGFYDGLQFHGRFGNSHIFGGDPNSRDGSSGARGTGNPGYTIADERGASPRPQLHDTIVMHRPNGVDSAGSIFYFSMRPVVSPTMTGNTVFGRVIDGLDVMRRLQADDRIISAEVIRARDHAYEPVTTPVDGANDAAADDAPMIPELPPAPPLGGDPAGDDGSEGSVGGTD